MSGEFELVLGTRNSGKQYELELLLRGKPIRVRTLKDFPDALEIEESGNTFAENARLKATLQSRHLGRWVMGEDSGLCVDALGGRPGVHSARFGGKPRSDEANNRRLIEEMRDVPEGKRGAHYVCHMTLSDPDGNPVIDVERTCRGRITVQPRGEAGFGYDPWFEIIEYGQTFAELGDSIKAVLSHRARAMRDFLPALEIYLGRVASGA